MPLPDRDDISATPALMIQGTGSHVGKSLIVAGLCRAFARRGLTVRPFKPQNMSNNAAVAAGGEIGRAQALQARACGTAPTVDMNPVLLKPEGETGSQVVVQGRVESRAGARDYHALKPRLMPRVLESFARLSEDAELILVEGAGSPAEVNLRAGDIANMGFAVAARVPVLIVADVERGGALASLIGTWDLLEASERRLVHGYLVNKFRGDVSLFDDALGVIGVRTGLDCLGVVPHFAAAGRLPAEDSVALDSRAHAGANAGAIHVAVPRLPRIANFDDLDPLAAEPGVQLEIVPPGRPLPVTADLIILPGSKASLADLEFLRREGWNIDIRAAYRRGTRVIGLCAGYQMLGRRIADPDGIEGTPGAADGLGLLDAVTVIAGDKTLAEARGKDIASGAAVSGYEMHMGRTTGPDLARPMLELAGRPEGARSADGRVAGTTLHGLFASDDFRRALLAELGAARDGERSYEAVIDDTLDRLADHLQRHLDLDRLFAIARGRPLTGPAAGRTGSQPSRNP